jgi:phosphoribosylformylglycinamidine synthase
VEYLDNLAVKIGRKLTDSEIFGFASQFRALSSQDFQRKICYWWCGKESSLFKMIKKTSLENPNDIVSAYKDNVAL